MEAALKPGSNGGFPCFKTSCWRRADRQRVLISSARLITWPWIVWNSMTPTRTRRSSASTETRRSSARLITWPWILRNSYRLSGRSSKQDSPSAAGASTACPQRCPVRLICVSLGPTSALPGLPGCAKEGQSVAYCSVGHGNQPSPAHAIHQPQVALLTPTIECHRRSWHNPAASTTRTGHGQEIGQTANISVG